MPANPPSRSTQNLTLSFNGLFVVPCALYSASEESSISRKQYRVVVDETGPMKGVEQLHPVGSKSYDKITGGDVVTSDIVKMVELIDDDGNESLVPITDDEIAQAMGDSATGLEIVGFLPLSHLSDGTYSMEKPFQLRPKKEKRGKVSVPNSAADKAFALLTEVMQRKGVFALVNFTARSRPRFAAFTPDGSLTTLRFDEETRAPLPMPLAELSEAEVNMGEMLVSANMLDQPPVLLDTANNAVRVYAAEKAKALKDGTVVPTPVAAEEPKANNDLLAALAAAVEASGKK